MNWLLALLKRYWGPTIAIVSLGLSVYFFWYQEYGKSGEVSVVVTATGNVLTIQRQVPQLEIIYRGKGLVDTGKTLRFYSLHVRNVGQVHILRTFFEEQVPWGLRLPGAEILQVTSTSFSVPALANTRPHLTGADFLRLEPVNLDVGDWIRIEFVALTDATKEPLFEHEGRISGTRLSVRYELPGTEPPFIDQVFGGSPAIQVVRGLFYTIALIAILAATIAALIFISERRDAAEARARAKEIEDLEPIETKLSDEQKEQIFTIYRESGMGALRQFRKFLSNEAAHSHAAVAEVEVKKLKLKDPDIPDGMVRHMAMHALKGGDYVVDGSILDRRMTRFVVSDDGVLTPELTRTAAAFAKDLLRALRLARDGKQPSKNSRDGRRFRSQSRRP